MQLDNLLIHKKGSSQGLWAEPISEVTGISKEEWLASSEKEIMKNIDFSKKPNNNGVYFQVQQSYIDRDKIIEDFEEGNSSEFVKFNAEKQKELAIFLNNNKGFMKIFSRMFLRSKYKDIIEDKRISLENLENAYIYELYEYHNFDIIDKIEAQYNQRKGLKDKNGGFKNKSRHDNSSHTSGSGSY